MRTLIFVCSFLLMTTLAMAQSSSILRVTNYANNEIRVGAQTTTSAPPSCSVTITGSVDYAVPIYPSTTVDIPLGAGYPDPPTRPYVVGADFWTLGASSWQINDCAYPSCGGGTGYFTIVVTSCTPYLTEVEVYE